MTALRWILLLAGLAFLGGMACWELWRARRSQASAAPLPGRVGADTVPFPAAPPRRAPSPPPAALSPPLLGADAVSSAAEPEHSGEPCRSTPGDAPADSAAAAADGAPHPPAHGLAATDDEVQLAAASVEAPAVTLAPHPPQSAADGLSPSPAQPVPSAPLLVEWPPESERYILSVRLVAGRSEPLSGRLLRQALEFCGFQHGRFGIFHQPGFDGRALLSAASLNKPGIFDPLNMDFQSFSGLSLFAVLPGPLPCAAALDHLLHTARELAQRVHGRLQDEQGATLDADSIERLKRRLEQLPGGSRQEESVA